MRNPALRRGGDRGRLLHNLGSSDVQILNFACDLVRVEPPLLYQFLLSHLAILDRTERATGGHGKIEFFSAGLEGLLIMLAALPPVMRYPAIFIANIPRPTTTEMIAARI